RDRLGRAMQPGGAPQDEDPRFDLCRRLDGWTRPCDRQAMRYIQWHTAIPGGLRDRRVQPARRALLSRGGHSPDARMIISSFDIPTLAPAVCPRSLSTAAPRIPTGPRRRTRVRCRTA